MYSINHTYSFYFFSIYNEYLRKIILPLRKTLNYVISRKVSFRLVGINNGFRFLQIHEEVIHHHQENYHYHYHYFTERA